MWQRPSRAKKKKKKKLEKRKKERKKEKNLKKEKAKNLKKVLLTGKQQQKNYNKRAKGKQKINDKLFYFSDRLIGKPEAGKKVLNLDAKLPF